MKVKYTVLIALAITVLLPVLTMFVSAETNRNTNSLRGLELLAAYDFRCATTENSDIADAYIKDGALFVIWGSIASYPRIVSNRMPADLTDYTISVDVCWTTENNGASATARYNIIYANATTDKGAARTLSMGFYGGLYDGVSHLGEIYATTFTTPEKYFLGFGNYESVPNTPEVFRSFVLSVKDNGGGLLQDVTTSLNGINIPVINNTSFNVSFASSYLAFSGVKGLGTMGIDNIVVTDNTTKKVIYSENFDDIGLTDTTSAPVTTAAAPVATVTPVTTAPVPVTDAPTQPAPAITKIPDPSTTATLTTATPATTGGDKAENKSCGSSLNIAAVIITAVGFMVLLRQKRKVSGKNAG